LRALNNNKGTAAMKIREIPLDDLVLDPQLNLRDRLDDFTVERYADAWERLPPITVYDVDDRLLIADGFHRHAAAVMLGKRTIRAEIRQGTMTDALDFVATVNLFHGLPLSRAERRRAVEIKLKLHHDWSDRRMAEELTVSRELIAKIRRQLIESRQIPSLPGRVGADGKLYTTAGLPKEAPERPAKGEGEEPTERGRRGMGAAAPPWVEPKGAAPPAGKAAARGAEIGEAAAGKALTGPLSAEIGAATIDEMLELMSKQIMQVIQWTQAEGFLEAYKNASPNARGLFHTAAIKLAARADQLRRG
jgi:ParB-like chromosome segregation protein Spo0J